MWSIDTVEYYTAMKNNDRMPFVLTWMDLEMIILSKVGQRKKDKCHMLSLRCRILKNDTNDSIYETETDSETLTINLWLPKGNYVGGRTH